MVICARPTYKMLLTKAKIQTNNDEDDERRRWRPNENIRVRLCIYQYYILLKCAFSQGRVWEQRQRPSEWVSFGWITHRVSCGRIYVYIPDINKFYPFCMRHFLINFGESFLDLVFVVVVVVVVFARNSRVIYIFVVVEIDNEMRLSLEWFDMSL